MKAHADALFSHHMLSTSTLLLQVYDELFSDGTPERLQEIFNSLENEESGMSFAFCPCVECPARLSGSTAAELDILFFSSAV